MWRYLIVGLIVLLAVAFVLYTFFSYFLGISGTKSTFETDRANFKDYLKSVDLSPWNLEELDILSRDGEMDREEGLLATTEKGVIYSIYKEPLIAYAVRIYRSTARKSMAIRIQDRIYEYELKGNKRFVKCNDEALGSITVNSKISYDSNEYRVALNLSEKGSRIPAIFDGQQLASVRRFEDRDEEGRVVEVFSKLTKGQAHAFLVLLAFAIVDEQI